MKRKTIEILTTILVALVGAGLFSVALIGDINTLTPGRFWLGFLGLFSLAVGVSLFLNWIDTWIC